MAIPRLPRDAVPGRAPHKPHSEACKLAHGSTWAGVCPGLLRRSGAAERQMPKANAGSPGSERAQINRARRLHASSSHPRLKINRLGGCAQWRNLTVFTGRFCYVFRGAYSARQVFLLSTASRFTQHGKLGYSGGQVGLACKSAPDFSFSPFLDILHLRLFPECACINNNLRWT